MTSKCEFFFNLLCFALFFFNSTSTDMISFSRQNPNSFRINSVHSIARVDPKINSCDVTMKEFIGFSFPQPTNEIRYALFSKSNSLYGFKIRKVPFKDDDCEIVGNKYYFAKGNNTIFSLNSLEPFLKNLQVGNELHERWIFVTQLSKNVTKVTMEYEYTIQRGIEPGIDDEPNVLSFSLINPYSFDINDYQFNLNISNFRSIQREKYNLSEGNVTYSGNDLEVNYYYSFPKESEIKIHLPLPREISSCETSSNVIITITIIGVLTFLALTIFFIVSISLLSKE